MNDALVSAMSTSISSSVDALEATDVLRVNYDDLSDSICARLVNGNSITINGDGWLTSSVSVGTISPDIPYHSWTDDIATKYELDRKADKEYVYGLEQRVGWLESTLYQLKDKLNELLTRVNISEDDLAELLGI